ncbi:MAG TPA: hypothetical protein VM915_15400 [Verrucomicrobiae bacterium]|nr:hypothetical protein [Verrucomicrobiae bacterium]
MSNNRALGSGDEEQMRLLAGFEEYLDEGGGSGSRGASGFLSAPLLERVWRAAAAAVSGGGGFGGGGGRDVDDPGLIDRQ